MNSNVQLSGADAVGILDLDMYFFSATCDSTGAISTPAVNEVGLMAAGTKYVLRTSTPSGPTAII